MYIRHNNKIRISGVRVYYTTNCKQHEKEEPLPKERSISIVEGWSAKPFNRLKGFYIPPLQENTNQSLFGGDFSFLYNSGNSEIPRDIH